MPKDYTIDDLYKACESGTINKINAILKKIPIDNKCVTLALKNNKIRYSTYIILDIAMKTNMEFELETIYEIIKQKIYHQLIGNILKSCKPQPDIQCMYLACQYYYGEVIEYCHIYNKYDIKCLELLCSPAEKDYGYYNYAYYGSYNIDKIYNNIIADGIVPNIQCLRNVSGFNTRIYEKIVNSGLKPDIECLRNAFLYKRYDIVSDILARGILPDNECMVNLCKCLISKYGRYYVDKRMNEYFNKIIAAGIEPTEECLNYACESGNIELAAAIIDYGVAPTFDCLLKVCSMKNVDSLIIKIIEKGVIPDYNCLVSLCKTKNNKKALREVLKHVNGDNECIYSAYTKK